MNPDDFEFGNKDAVEQAKTTASMAAGHRTREPCPTCGKPRWHTPYDPERKWEEHVLPGSHRVDRQAENECGALEKVTGVDP